MVAAAEYDARATEGVGRLGDQVDQDPVPPPGGQRARGRGDQDRGEPQEHRERDQARDP